MTPTEFKQARHALGLSGQQLATILNVDARNVRRWEAGERPPNPIAVRVLGWMIDGYRPPQWPQEPHWARKANLATQA